MKDGNEIIDQFTNSCDVVKASTIFVKLTVANSYMRSLDKNIHPDAAWNVDNKNEETIQALQAISTLLFEIEKTIPQ